MNNDAFEELWENMAMVFANPTDEIMVKNVANKVYEASTKAALGSRVVLPKYPEGELSDYGKGYAKCLDSIKLIPLTAEQVDSLLPSDEEIWFASNTQVDVSDAGEFRFGARWLRESIKKRLGAV